MRRQGHSCDQCRRSKRACDAFALEDSEAGGTAFVTGVPRSAPKTRPCSYCARTRKECTINWAWTQMRIRRALEAETYGQFVADDSSPAKRRKQDSTSPQSVAQPTSSDDSFGFTDSFSGYLQDMPADESQTAASTSASCDAFLVSQQAEDTLSWAEWQEIVGLSVHQTQTEWSTMANFDADGAEPFPCSAFLSNLAYSNQGHGQLGWGPEATGWSDSTYSPTTQSPSTSTIAEDAAVFGRRASLKRGRPHSPSSFATNHRIAKHANESLISTNLLRIYHDVLEHSLSCWLTELTCPYQSRPASKQKGGVDLAEWGSSWSNRLYHRTLKLEEAAKKAKLVQLSPAEDRACSRALHLAIMAFATQWPQGNRRQHEACWSSNDSLAEDSWGELTKEFDMEIQWHFWTRAEQALQEVTGVESFRLACAEAILGLVQKPSNREHEVTGFAATKTSGRISPGVDQESLRLEISQVILEHDSPKYMERAARRMHTLKFKCDLAMKGVAQTSHSDGVSTRVQSMSEDDQTSLGLLYWLAVMFDTVSSSMNHRPLTVSDQDCQHRDSRGEDVDNSHWNIDLFVQDSLNSPTQRTRWPCAYAELAEAVTKSGPVKVLLYRHVAWLQNSLRRGQQGEKLESIVRSAMDLYFYWNATYGQLFRDMVRDFDCVPGRIRSWFVCISGHWHLAAFLLAELIETVDKQELGTREGKDQRLGSSTVTRIKDTSVDEVSDLARVASPYGNGQSTEPQLPGFHPSVNEGTILTDPWTVVLVQAFSKAAVMLLAKADHYRRYALMEIGGDGLAETIRRAQGCIKGLWFLGKKSDMARGVAGILTRELQLHLGTAI